MWSTTHVQLCLTYLSIFANRLVVEDFDNESVLLFLQAKFEGFIPAIQYIVSRNVPGSACNPLTILAPLLSWRDLSCRLCDRVQVAHRV